MDYQKSRFENSKKFHSIEYENFSKIIKHKQMKNLNR